MLCPENSTCVLYPNACTTCCSVGSPYLPLGSCSEYFCQTPESAMVDCASSASLELIVSVPGMIATSPLLPTPVNLIFTVAVPPAAIDVVSPPLTNVYGPLSTIELIFSVDEPVLRICKVA